MPKKLARVLFVLLLASSASAPAVVLYEASGGFNPNGFNLLSQGITPQVQAVSEFSFGGALCPAPGTTDFLCGWLHGESGVANGRLFLKAGVALKRTNAQAAVPSVAAYAGGRMTIPELGGYQSQAPTAAFYLGLAGTITKTASAGVTVDAFSMVRVQAGVTDYVTQCFNTLTGCVPGVKEVVVQNWTPSTGLYMDLRSDVAIGVPQGASGYDAEAIADFSDTIELLAIELRDANGDPIPGVSLYVPDDEGEPMLTIPNTPPDTTTTTTTSLAGATTTLPGGTTALPIAGKLLAMKDSTKPAKRKVVFVAKDPAIVPATLDPTVAGVQVVVASLQTGESDTWTLPPSGWSSKKAVFKYADKAHAAGPVTAASIGKGKITVQAKGEQIGYALLGTGPQHSVGVQMLLPGTLACALFPGAQGNLKKDDSTKGLFKAVGAEAPLGCALP